MKFRELGAYGCLQHGLRTAEQFLTAHRTRMQLKYPADTRSWVRRRWRQRSWPTSTDARTFLRGLVDRGHLERLPSGTYTPTAAGQEYHQRLDRQNAQHVWDSVAS
ncbi:MAG: hypothetical protein KKD94_02590 [Nanoarchaeota archaeon]|nr:hypothetical protein [Nanoarchaeota archaeon]